jgi:hypothetical protein
MASMKTASKQEELWANSVEGNTSPCHSSCFKGFHHTVSPLFHKAAHLYLFDTGHRSTKG